MKSIEGLARAASAAATRIRPYVRHTWVERSELLSAESGAEVFCKLENLQHTGSFKARGAVNGLHDRVLARTPAGRWGDIEDLEGLAVFFASPASNFITGVAMPVDGGFSVSG